MEGQGMLETIIALLVGQYPAITVVLAAVGSLVVLGQIVVVFTPSPKDNAAYEKVMGTPIVGMLLKALTKFSVIQKK